MDKLRELELLVQQSETEVSNYRSALRLNEQHLAKAQAELAKRREALADHKVAKQIKRYRIGDRFHISRPRPEKTDREYVLVRYHDDDTFPYDESAYFFVNLETGNQWNHGARFKTRTSNLFTMSELRVIAAGGAEGLANQYHVRPVE